MVDSGARSLGAPSARLIQAFLVTSGGTATVALFQLAYASLTARLLNPQAFGAYAVALSAVGVVGLLGGATLGEATARRDHDSSSEDRSMAGAALLWGVASAALLWLLAPNWGSLWGIPESATTTRVLAVSIPLTNLAAVEAGFLRRQGRTARATWRISAGALVGMALGLPVIFVARATWSLAVSPVLGGLFSVLLLSLALSERRAIPSLPSVQILQDVAYSLKAAALSVLRYGLNTVSIWAIGRFVGADALGYYNRATTIVTVPLEGLQRAFTYSLFPELRPNAPSLRGPSAFTKLMAVLTWVMIFVAGVGYFAAGPLLDLLLGKGWGDSAMVAGLALLMGAGAIVGAPLGARLEALGVFQPAILATAVQASIIAVGTAATIVTERLQPAMLGMLFGSLSNSLVSLWATHRRGLLDLNSYLRLTWPMLLFQVPATVILSIAVSALNDSPPVAVLLVVAVIGLVEFGLVWLALPHCDLGRWLRYHLRSNKGGF